MSTIDPVAWLRARAFPARAHGRAARVGVEVELLSLDAETRRPVDVATRLLPFLRTWTGPRGGREITGAKGGTRITLPDGSVFAIEPGGQLELASTPSPSPSDVLRSLDHVLRPLSTAAADAGIDLLGAGIDPYNPPGVAPLQIAAERYCRMDAYFQSIGPAGRRMMRQTAAVQVNVDPAGPPLDAWRAFNAAAPYLTALFARSRRYAGHDTGCASYRAETWRGADPARTGLFTEDGDPAAAYARFALDAPVMSPAPDGEYRPFRVWLEAGRAGEHAWEDHLTTLFPEVRPKGYLEVRSMDAQPIDGLALPVLLCAGIALDPTATAEARDLLGPADPDLLLHAGRAGLADCAIAGRCRELMEIGLRGCARLGPGRVAHADLERVSERAEERMGAAAV